MEGTKHTYINTHSIYTYVEVLVTLLLLLLQVASVLSDSVRPHRRQPTRLPRPWDSPGKNTGLGCHFLLQCMKVKSESEVIQSCQTPSDPVDCSPPGLTNLDSILKSRDILPTKARLVKAMVFPVVVYGCESWTIKKAEC